MKKKYYMLFFLCLLSLSGFAQEINVTGVVTEAMTKDPLPGVTIQVKGSGQGTITDMDGKFMIAVSKNTVLVFSTIGMKTVEHTVTSDAPIHVVLEEDNVVLDQVVVIGYGTVKKSHLSGAVGSVGTKELRGELNTSTASALQGKLPGVTVTTNGGGPNDGTTINVRGISSLSNNTPLYVIDGAFGDINMVDPNDIQSIEVLKDAAAAAIYGLRAAGGVVLITTKGGRRESPTKVDVNFFTGIQHNPKKLNVMTGEEYSRFARYYGLAGDGFGAEKDAIPFVGKGTDWQDVMFRTAMTYKANASISGGSKNATFNTSVSYLNKDGILRNTSHESYNIRLKGDYTFLNNRVTIGETMILRLSKGEGGSDYEMNGLLRFPSVIPVYDPTNSSGWGTSADINLPNPLANSMIVDNTQKSTNIFLNAYIQAEIIKGLKYKLNFGFRKDHGSSRSYTHVYDLGTYGINEAPDLTEGYSDTESWVLENTLNYDRTFGKHSIQALVGYSAQKDRYYSLTGSNTDLPEFIDTMTGNVNTMSSKSSVSELSLVSMFARVMYSYDDRYLFSASIRRDGSSRFAAGNRFGYFPSVSVGWNVSQEKFFKPLTFLFDQVKLRASYGKLGNQEMSGYYPTVSVVSDGMNYLQGNNIWFGKLPFVNAVSPEDLTWENTETYNIGLDLTLLAGRLNLTADAYIKNTNDVLIPVPSASSTGISGMPIMNAGKVRNKGIEISATWRQNIGDKGSYYVGANFSTANNRVEEITAGGKVLAISGYSAHAAGGKGINMFKKGHSMAYFNLIETDGIFRSMEEIENYRSANGEMIQPGAQVGDIRYKDWNRDGVIDTNDQHDVGSPLPNFTFGLRAGGEWKGFDLNLFIDGMTGNKIYNYTRYCLESGAFNGNLSTTVANSWRPDNPNTDMPRFSKVDGSDNKLAFTDRWLEDGSYIRLKSLDLGYTFPKRWMQKIYIQNLRLYVSMENLLTLSKYSGYSPDLGESSSTGASYSIFSKGIDHGRYPIPRTFSFGIQVSL